MTTGIPVLGAMPLSATGRYPIGVMMGDLDRDGKLDAVTVNRGADSVSVLLGTGDGRFAPKVDYTTGSAPNAVAVGDLDGDGVPDVIVADSFAYKGVVSVLRGVGQGKLAARVDYVLGQAYPWALAVGDVNADGKLDVVVVDRSSMVSVLLGSGDGKLEVKASFPTASTPMSVAIADMDGDHKPDLIIPGWSEGRLSIHAGNGDGTFAAMVEYPLAGSTVAVAVGDLDGAFGPDVVTVTADGSNGSIAGVLLSTGDGKLAPIVKYPIGEHFPNDSPHTNNGNPPAELVLADVNADGKLDVIETNDGAGTVSVLLGTGGGKLAAKVDYATGGSPLSVAAGDLNGDGKVDLAIVNAPTDTLVVLLGKGDGTFGSFSPDVARLDQRIGVDATAGAIGDVNGDGKLDVVVVGGDKAIVLRGLGDGHFASGASYPVGPNPGVTLGDVNGDGKLDLLVPNAGVVSVWLGTGAGEFSGQVDYPTGSAPHGVALGDLNNDGQPDMVTPNSLQASVAVLLNTGGGTFGQKMEYTTDVSPSAMALGDLNGDGKLDVVTVNSFPGTASVLLGIGDGRLAAKVDYPISNGASSLVLGDLNADGTLDIVAVHRYGQATVLAGNGDGTFDADAAVYYVVGLNSVGVVIADVTADGRPDILFAGGDSNTVTVLPGAPGGVSAAKLEYVTGAGPNINWLAAGDLDGDGRIDLVFPAFGDTVAVLLNTCP
jgi:hypothetical protein